jgi:hypothetical protein
MAKSQPKDHPPSVETLFRSKHGKKPQKGG